MIFKNTETTFTKALFVGLNPLNKNKKRLGRSFILLYL